LRRYQKDIFMFNSRNIIAAILAGIAGTIANSIAVSAALGAPLLDLIFSFGREAVAILVALLLIPIFARMEGAAAWLTGFLTLAIVPSILAKTVFAIEAGWTTVLILNAVYAITAVIVYVLIAKRSVV
tara:strand:- start:442 stop:825 length:384 start_codon:yes stop_codon:yes gene_type:complete